MAISGDADLHQGRRPPPLQNRFQVAGCDHLAFKPKLKLELQRQDQARRLPGAWKATLTAKPGDANIASASVALPALGLPRPGAHRHGLHPRAVRRRRLPDRLDLRQRQGHHPPARLAPQRQRLPALLLQPAARPGGRPQRPDQPADKGRAGRTHRLQERRHPQQLRPRPRCPRHQVHAWSSAAARRASWSTPATSAPRCRGQPSR